MTLSTKCAANPRGVVCMVALPRACVCGKVCASVCVVSIRVRSRSWPQGSENSGNVFLLINRFRWGNTHFFTVPCFLFIHGDRSESESPRVFQYQARNSEKVRSPISL